MLSSYKVVDLRGKFCPTDSDWDTHDKDLGVVIHYNGPLVPARGLNGGHENITGWIKFITDLHRETGRFEAGWTFDGIAYHEFVLFDTAYWLRNHDAVLLHCGSRTWNHGSIDLHVPIGVSQQADPITLCTLAKRTSYHLKKLGSGRTSAKGHREVKVSECPSDHLMNDFVSPYLAGNEFVGEPEPKKGPEYAYLAASNASDTEHASAAWHALEAAGHQKALMATADGDVRNAAEKSMSSEENGRVCLVIGAPTVEKLPGEAREALAFLDPDKEWRAGESVNLWNCVGRDFEHTRGWWPGGSATSATPSATLRARALAEYRERSDRLEPEEPRHPPAAEKRRRFGFVGAPRFTADELLACLPGERKSMSLIVAKKPTRRVPSPATRSLDPTPREEKQP